MFHVPKLLRTADLQCENQVGELAFEGHFVKEVGKSDRGKLLLKFADYIDQTAVDLGLVRDAIVSLAGCGFLMGFGKVFRKALEQHFKDLSLQCRCPKPRTMKLFAGRVEGISLVMPSGKLVNQMKVAVNFQQHALRRNRILQELKGTLDKLFHIATQKVLPQRENLVFGLAFVLPMLQLQGLRRNDRQIQWMISGIRAFALNFRVDVLLLKMIVFHVMSCRPCACRHF